MKRPKHRAFIRQLSCAACLNDICSEPAHVRFSRPDKPNPGMGAKSDDKWTNPLCRRCHDRQHSHPKGERGFWSDLGIDPHELSERLFAVTGNVLLGESIVRETFYNRRWRLT